MIGVAGISYKTAELCIRERLVMQEAEQKAFIDSLRRYIPFLETIILCTCNRTEVYFYAKKNCFSNLCSFIVERLLKFRGVDYESVQNCIYTMQNEKAVEHLFQVASGLDSLVLGENEILGQVKNAYAWSVRQGYTSAVFNRLFHKAFETGKRVRTETTINQRASSVSSVAVELCQQKLAELQQGNVRVENLQELPILLLGAGKNSERLLKSLVKKGCRKITVMSRRFEHAKVLAGLYNVKAETMDRLSELLSEQRLIITSTAASQPLIFKNEVEAVLEKKPDWSFILIDLSVPRDIEEEVRALPQVTLFDLDDLKRLIYKSQEERKDELEQASKIIRAGVEEFSQWLNEQWLKPTVRLLKERINTITLSSLELIKKKKGFKQEKTEREQDLYADWLLCLAARIEKKYLGLIVKNLKAISENGKKMEYIKFVNRLFDLEEFNNKHKDEDYIQYKLRNN